MFTTMVLMLLILVLPWLEWYMQNVHGRQPNTQPNAIKTFLVISMCFFFVSFVFYLIVEVLCLFVHFLVAPLCKQRDELLQKWFTTIKINFTQTHTKLRIFAFLCCFCCCSHRFWRTLLNLQLFSL